MNKTNFDMKGFTPGLTLHTEAKGNSEITYSYESSVSHMKEYLKMTKGYHFMRCRGFGK